MRLHVNGTPREVASGTTVGDLVASLVNGDLRGTAVAIDGEVVVRRDWPTTVLGAGARVEVLRAVQGGSR